MKYIGETYKPQGLDIELVKGQEYSAEIQYAGTPMFINGQMKISDSCNTVWVQLQDNGRIPYAPSLLPNFWEVGEDYLCSLL